MACPRTLHLLTLRSLRPFSSSLPQTTSPIVSSSSKYHSYTHPPSPPYPPSETAVLNSALKHIPEHGFSENTLVRGARDAGFLPISVNLLPRGVFELVMFWLVDRRLALKDRSIPEAMGVGGRVRGLVLERLRMNAEMGVVPRWSEVSLQFSLIPTFCSWLQSYSSKY